MANYYRNPTAAAAIGAVDKEIYRIRKHAKQLRNLQAQGKLTKIMLKTAAEQYSGFYRRVFENAFRS